MSTSTPTSTVVWPPQRVQVLRGVLSYKTAVSQLWNLLINPSASPSIREYNVQGIDMNIGKLTIELRIDGVEDECVLSLTLDQMKDVKLSVATDPRTEKVMFVLEFDVQSRSNCSLKVNDGATRRQSLGTFPLASLSPTITSIQVKMLISSFLPSGRSEVLIARMTAILNYNPLKLPEEEAGNDRKQPM